MYPTENKWIANEPFFKFHLTKPKYRDVSAKFSNFFQFLQIKRHAQRVELIILIYIHIKSWLLSK